MRFGVPGAFRGAWTLRVIIMVSSVLWGQPIFHFYRQLATMLDAGLALERALLTLQEQAGYGALRQALEDIRERVASGDRLVEALRRHSGLFQELEIAVIDAGERSGVLPDNLERLADYLEALYHARRRLMVGLAYPVILVHLAILIPPIPILMSTGVGAYLETVFRGFLVLYGLAAGIYLLLRLIRRPESGRMLLDRILLSLPFFGRLLLRLSTSRFTRILATLYGAGIPVIESLRIASESCGNQVVSEAVLRVADGLDAGDRLSEAVAREPIFPRVFIEYVQTGEETGNLGGMMDKLGAYFRQEWESSLKLVVAVLPLLVYLSVALYIGYVVISFWLGHYGRLLD
jgi:type II secretory pathway component PulF